MQNQSELRLAVLIDADNVPRKSIAAVMEEIAVYGNATIKRIYGDWTNPCLSGWKARLLENALTPIQQYGYTVGKNSTDSALIIDAMDILYTGQVDGFCLVSSDSDFTRLAIRLREAGMKVFGFGEKKTPKPFIVACDRFIYIEVITKKDETPKPKSRVKPPKAPKQTEHVPPVKTADNPPTEPAESSPPEPQTELQIPAEVLDFVCKTIEDICDEDGWAYLGEVGSLLQKKRPDFDTRNYGFKKLTNLVQSLADFELDFRAGSGSNNGKLIYIRTKRSEPDRLPPLQYRFFTPSKDFLAAKITEEFDDHEDDVRSYDTEYRD